jgi:hypothetical protein
VTRLPATAAVVCAPCDICLAVDRVALSRPDPAAAAAALVPRRLDGGAAQEQMEASYRDYLQVGGGAGECMLGV